MNRSVAVAALAAFVTTTSLTCAPSGRVQPSSEMRTPPYLNPGLSVDERVDDIVSRMTLEEKVGQMVYNAPAIERLAVPAYNWWNEALHGVARAGRATVFPQAIGLAATWDTALMLRVATVISDEARAKHHESVRRGRRGIYEGLTFWSPNINIFRDPRWGRGMETYGEDPYLTGQLAVQFVKGLQGDDPRYLKTVATPKHFAVHSGPEPDRHTFNAIVDERDLRETYLPAFRSTIVDANAQSVMCAYNRVQNAPACASTELLGTILRGEWGFDGYVVSDCWAIQDIYTTHKVVESGAEAAAMSVAAGTDLNCGVTYPRLTEAVAQGLISEAEIDVAVKRLFRARFMLGMFDPPEQVPYARIPFSVNEAAEHAHLAVEAARASIVLLKNDGLLPLDKNIETIAVIGPSADDVDLLLGNYNGVPSNPVTPLEGIQRAVGDGTTVLYARGTDLAENAPSFELVPTNVLFTEHEGHRVNGLKGEYFDNHDFVGEPVVTRLDPALDFIWWDAVPVAGISADSFSARWTGTLVPPFSGRYALGVRVFGGTKLYLDDESLFEYSDRHVVMTRWVHMELEAGVPRDIRVEYFDRRADAIVQLVWSPPNPRLKNEALDAAARADAVVMMMGLSPRLEGEEMRVNVPGFSGGDRLDMKLPAPQEQLLREITGLGKPVILVLLNGSALAVNWAADNVPAIVEAWYPGQAAGTAIADVLFGDYNPAGRLPVTYYRSIDQLPPFSDYDMKGRTYRYFEGEPLFPFGHGLSYTTFDYSDLVLPEEISAGDDADVTVQVSNTGSLAGDEVVQLYVSIADASAPAPIRSLAGFKRVSLQPGEKRQVTFTLSARSLSHIDSENRRVVEPGMIQVSVGGKQPGFSGTADSYTSGVVRGQFRIGGRVAVLGTR